MLYLVKGEEYTSGLDRVRCFQGIHDSVGLNKSNLFCAALRTGRVVACGSGLLRERGLAAIEWRRDQPNVGCERGESVVRTLVKTMNTRTLDP